MKPWVKGLLTYFVYVILAVIGYVIIMSVPTH